MDDLLIRRICICSRPCWQPVFISIMVGTQIALNNVHFRFCSQGMVAGRYFRFCSQGMVAGRELVRADVLYEDGHRNREGYTGRDAEDEEEGGHHSGHALMIGVDASEQQIK